MKEPADMTREELLELVFSMSWSALNLAQHLSATQHLRVQYRREAYQKAVQMAYDLVYLWKMEEAPEPSGLFVLGDRGIVTGEEAMNYVPPPELEFDPDKLDQLWPFLVDAIPGDDEIAETEKAQRWIADLLAGKRSADHVEFKAKTLRRAMWPHERVTELAKAARKMLELLKGSGGWQTQKQ